MIFIPKTGIARIVENLSATRYRQSRYIVTLCGMLRLNKHVLNCQTPDCKQLGLTKRPEGEGALVLPHYTFGLDVVARIGEMRYRQHQTIEQIRSALGQQQVSISVKEVQLLSEVFSHWSRQWSKMIRKSSSSYARKAASCWRRMGFSLRKVTRLSG
ncbi:MAG: hypothetical protein KIT57_01160 [Blastocatellales bacterium]|nr:hypothetical protein [Blastocatellales bacterium]